MSDPAQLSKRERQIMDAIWARGEATVSQVIEAIPEPPTRTAVRTMLTILERKGHVNHRKDGRQFIYRPSRPRAQTARTALRRVLQTFFEGSLERAVAARLSDRAAPMTADEIERLSDLIERAKHRDTHKDM
ncbi:MAG: transcriptional repressor, CopY family [Phycisphaerales bacterium]|jgi:BlaI family penicillinase repressor|nr:transcriptional repressor, CopY family [Phycisphaerales bacterium]